MPSLQDIQQFVWKLITAPEGVEKALAADPQLVLPVKGDHRLSAAERLDIYANMYFYRIRDSLKEDFPGVLALLGEDHFHNLITDYLFAHPSVHWSLRYAGKDMPRFLTTHSSLQQWPFLPELATFEWALLEAFDAADAPVLPAEKLALVPPEDWALLSLQLVPSFQVFSFQYPVDRIREQVLAGEEVALAGEAIDLMVWRQELTVKYRRLEQGEATLLQEISKGTSFAHLCEIAEGMSENPLVWISETLQTWMSQGILLDR